MRGENPTGFWRKAGRCSTINPKGAATGRGEARVHEANQETKKRVNFGWLSAHNVETARRDGSVREG
jgi:hypothetical protein